MSVPRRITRRSAWPLATMASSVSSGDLEEDSTQTLQTPPILLETLLAMALPPLLPLALVDHQTLGGTVQDNSRRLEVLPVASSISELSVRYASSPNPWPGRSSGSCRWPSLV